MMGFKNSVQLVQGREENEVTSDHITESAYLGKLL